MLDRMHTGASESALVVLLHGFASSSRAWDVLIPLWRTQLPDACFSALDAPYACAQGGFKWFQHDFEAEADPEHDILSSRAAFDARFARLLAAHGFEGRLDRVCLVGFSQGASLALDVLARGRWPLGSVVCFAGRLLKTTLFQPPREAALLLVHGTNDSIVPEQEGRRAAIAFERHGVRVERHVVDANGHGICRKAAEIGGMFLRDRLVEEHFDASCA
jgi:phospholipase/carboxylesterase